jgi:dihydrofolate reductase
LLIKDNIAEEVKKLKQQPGKDLVIFGSPGLATTFMNLGLIDEYKLTVHPVILGNGISVFRNNTVRSTLKLLDAKTLKSGVSLVCTMQRVVENLQLQRFSRKSRTIALCSS